MEARGRQWGGVMNKGRRGTTGEKEEITGWPTNNETSQTTARNTFLIFMIPYIFDILFKNYRVTPKKGIRVFKSPYSVEKTQKCAQEVSF